MGENEKLLADGPLASKTLDSDINGICPSSTASTDWENGPEAQQAVTWSSRYLNDMAGDCTSTELPCACAPEKKDDFRDAVAAPPESLASGQDADSDLPLSAQPPRERPPLWRTTPVNAVSEKQPSAAELRKNARNELSKLREWYRSR